jgi:hypothetical protein
MRKTTIVATMLAALFAMLWSVVPASAEESKTCKFTTGPKKGQTLDYNDVPGVKAINVGMPCTDGFLSFGVAVPDADDGDDEEADDGDDGDDATGAAEEGDDADDGDDDGEEDDGTE